jgi:restriction endonuclease Mrr
MEIDRVQRYAVSLERTIQNNYHYLKETIDDFQEMCRMVTPERSIPTGILSDIREMYKEMRTRLTEIRAVAQLLQGKYRQYYHRDSLRDKEIMEFGFIIKNCYSKFEYTLMQIEAMKRLREASPKVDHQRKPFKWFWFEENQVTLIKNLRMLMELDYEPTPEEVSEERRDLAGKRNLTLFLFNGDSLSLDKLQSQIRLREHDIIERSGSDELRGVLTHLRKVDPSEVEKMFQRLMESMGFKKLKCLLLSIHSHKDLEGDLSGLIKTTLQEMTEGGVKTLSI